MILALDTASLTASAAVVAEDGRVLAEGEAAVRTHSEQLLPLVDDVLRRAGVGLGELRGLACGAGPGSFTGLRIGLATVKGLCYATGKPLYLVSSLHALALDASAPPGALLVPCLDARKREVFIGFFRAAEPLLPEAVLPPQDLAAALSAGRAAAEARVGGPLELLLVGDGAERYREHAEKAAPVLGGVPQTPRAAAVARLAWRRSDLATGDALATAAPTYIRPPEITPERRKIL